MTDAEITTREAARRLGVSQRNVVRYINNGLLPARRVWDDGPYLVKVTDVETITPGRSPHDPLLTDDFLRGVAGTVREVDKIGGSPRQELARMHQRSLGTADRWIMAARQRGFLDPE